MNNIYEIAHNLNNYDPHDVLSSQFIYMVFFLGVNIKFFLIDIFKELNPKLIKSLIDKLINT